MLELAVKAQLPLLAVTTTDTLNARRVIANLTGRTVVEFKGQTEKTLKPHTLYAGLDDKSLSIGDGRALYTALAKQESTLVILNPLKDRLLVHHCGQLPVPKKLVVSLLEKKLGPDTAMELTPALGGLTLTEVGEAVRITQARDGLLSGAGMLKTRKAFVNQQRGLEQVETNEKLYIPPAWLHKYATTEKAFFFNPPDERLRPRGIMADGPPGTGKTMAAKYIARTWGVPLYRLDLGAIKGKYVGQSEGRLGEALAKVDQEDPCVIVLDETEKLFSEQHDGGTTSSLLASLLWWLQEHTSRVFVLMTTNDLTAIPPEVYRPGRIDLVRRFEGLPVGQVKTFAHQVLETFDFIENPFDFDKYLTSWLQKKSETTHIPHAEVTQVVYTLVKYHLNKAAVDLDEKAS